MLYFQSYLPTSQDTITMKMTRSIAILFLTLSAVTLQAKNTNNAPIPSVQQSVGVNFELGKAYPIAYLNALQTQIKQPIVQLKTDECQHYLSPKTERESFANLGHINLSMNNEQVIFHGASHLQANDKISYQDLSITPEFTLDQIPKNNYTVRIEKSDGSHTNYPQLLQQNNDQDNLYSDTFDEYAVVQKVNPTDSSFLVFYFKDARLLAVKWEKECYPFLKPTQQ